jgi:hypothetical protein
METEEVKTQLKDLFFPSCRGNVNIISLNSVTNGFVFESI